MDAQQNAQIADQQQAAQPVYQQPAPPPQAAAPAQSTGLTPDDFAQLNKAAWTVA
jgi:hypothetical protein